MSGQRRQSFWAGVGPQSLEPGVAGATVAYPPELYQTPLLDLTVAPQSNIELVPARPGHIPININRLWVIELLTGTQVTPATMQAGSDATQSNFMPLVSSPTNANVNGFTTPFFFTGGSATLDTVKQLVNTPVFFNLVTPASGTGGFSLKGRLLVHVNWVSIGG